MYRPNVDKSLVLCFVFLAALWSVPARAQIPSTYNTSHPRLPHPDTAYLQALAASPTVLAHYTAAAANWDPSHPANAAQFRRLLIAYLVSKAQGAPNQIYLQKIIQTVSSATTSGWNLDGFYGAQVAIAYDWLYGDLDAATRATFLNTLESLATQWEVGYGPTSLNASPYNDQTYIRMGPDGLFEALAIYPDYDQVNPTGGTCPTKPCGTYHMNWFINTFFTDIIPVWQQVFGPDGGGWHETWNSYDNPPSGIGLTQWIVPCMLSWQSATGDPVFTRLPWLKNWAYYTMYMTRPDFTMEHIGEEAAGVLSSEYNLDYGAGAGFGSLNGLAEIYNDPVLRGWARLVNQEFPSGPDGFEPSAWPFYTPDNNSKPVATRASLPTSRNFPGWGVVFARSGWGEDDTYVTLKYGDNFWSHAHADAGNFTISHRGQLAITSGNYRPGSNSPHEIMYGKATISQNSLLIIDPNDYYPSETFCQIDYPDGSSQCNPIPNDGGQRRVGTFYNQRFPQMHSPSNIQDWQASYEYYHMGTLAAYAAKPGYTYASVDITPAYNNQLSSSTPNSTNRTNRASSVRRNLVFIPPGYVIIFDEVNATNASFVKKFLLHSINQPAVSGNRYQILRTEKVSQPIDWTQPYDSLLTHNTEGASPTYQYDGKLTGWMVYPQGGAISLVGGPGKEFWIPDPQKSGAGTNWNQCMQGQCSGSFWGFLAGSTPDFLSPNPAFGLIEPGSWRMEETPGTPANQDYFLNVMQATNAEDTNVPQTVTGLQDATTLGATWSDNSGTYTIRFNKTGIGGHITIQGAVNVNEDLAGSGPSASPCDLNADGATNVADVQLEVNATLGVIPCASGDDLNKDSQCTVIDVQRVVNAVLGGACVTGP